jgi:hypothetical protein
MIDVVETVVQGAGDEIIVPPDTEPETPAAKRAEFDAPSEERLAPRFAELARREKLITAREAEWRPKFDEAERFAGAKAKLREDPFAALELLGCTMQDIVDAALRHGEPETVELKIERLERERADERRAAQEMSEQHAQRVLDEHRHMTVQFVDSRPDEYEMLVATGQQHVVFDMIESHWAETGEVLPVADAATVAEDYFLEEAERLMATKKLSSKRLSSKYRPPASLEGGGARAPSMSAASTKGAPAAPAAPTGETHEQRIQRIASGIASRQKR